MKLFSLHLLKVVALTIGLVAVVKYWVWPPAVRRMLGEPTGERIAASFTAAAAGGYDCILLGNSRIYRGVNPDRFKTWRAYNFAHDADAFNQTWYKLDYLERHGVRISAIILSLDYFDFGQLPAGRNANYGRYFRGEYLDDYPNTLASDLVSLFVEGDRPFKHYMNYTFTLPAYKWMEDLGRTFSREPRPPSSFQRPNGQYMVLPVTKAKPGEGINREPEATLFPVQVGYFNRIIGWARSHHVELFLVTAPCRPEELGSYRPETLARFRRIFAAQGRQPGVHYLDYSTDPRFTIDDFADINHLNPSGADKFSDILDHDVAEIRMRR